MFRQVAKQVLKHKPRDLCFPSRAWKIRLVDEAADDAGGVFDEIMTEMCQVFRVSLLAALSYFMEATQGYVRVFYAVTFHCVAMC